jgi:hypothetical protein
MTSSKSTKTFVRTSDPPLQTKQTLSQSNVLSTTMTQNITNAPSTHSQSKTNTTAFDSPFEVSIELSCDGFSTKMLDRKHEETQCREFYKDYEDADETSSSETGSGADALTASFTSEPSTHTRKRKYFSLSLSLFLFFSFDHIFIFFKSHNSSSFLQLSGIHSQTQSSKRTVLNS